VTADEFGHAVALAGDEAFVAARADGTGATRPGWVRTWIAGSALWSPFARLEATDGAATQRFGESLAVSGAYAVAGTPRDDDFGTISGSAYIFIRGATGWSQQVKLHATTPAAFDEFGIAVAIAGDYAIVGARSDDDGGSQSGSAFIYRRNVAAWPLQKKIIANDDATKDLFGSAVAIDGTYALVGAPGDDTNTGSAYVFLRSGTNWTQQAKLIAGDRTGGDVFGTSVAIFGEYAAIGAPGDDGGRGAVYLYKRTGTAWAQVARILATGGAAGDKFGSALAMTDVQVLAGAPGYNGERGAAYLLERSGTSWIELARYVAAGAITGQRLGASVAFDGASVLAGMPGHGGGAGAALLFQAIQLDCNSNGVPDVCDTSCAAVNPLTGTPCSDFPNCGTLADCNGDTIPDACEPDCDADGTPDACALAAGAPDCNTNGVPDGCEPDCNANGVADTCDLAGGTSGDCDASGVPDECELFAQTSVLSADFADVGLPPGWSADGLWHVTDQCGSGAACDAAGGWAYFGLDAACNFATGATESGVLTSPPVLLPAAATAARLSFCSLYDGDRGVAPDGFDAAWVAVNGTIVADVGATVASGSWETRMVDLAAFAGQTISISWHFDSNDPLLNHRLGWQVDGIELIVDSDCDGNGVLDTCDLAGGSADCNANGRLDTCDLAGGTSADCDGDGIPDECAGGDDCNLNGVPDFCETVILHVDAQATGDGTGVDWEHAYTDLAAALTDATAECLPVEIWVARGVYAPAAPGGPRTATFALANRVAIYGGFSGDELVRAARNADPLTNGTVLSGDIDGDGPGGNSYHVVTAAGVGANAILDGFTIRDGVANGTNPDDRGAGLRMTQSSARVSNCLFTGHSAVAGAISITGGAPAFTRCDVIGNTAQFGGGWHIITSASPTLTACRVLGNVSTAGGAGGGLFVSANCAPRLENCLLTGNSAVGSGGALFVQSSSTPTLVNCTLASNIAGQSGGGLFAAINSAVTTRNSILWNNQDVGGAGQSAQLASSNSTHSVNHSCVQGWTGSLGGTGNFGADPLWLDAPGPDGTAGTLDDDLRLSPTSPCIDAGDNGALTAASDLAGLPRRVDDADTPDTGAGAAPVVDIGAHEHQSGCVNCQTPGDWDADGDVDADDGAAFVACAGHPVASAGYVVPSELCGLVFDIDADGDIDLADYAALQTLMGG